LKEKTAGAFDAQAPVSAFAICMSSHTQAGEEQFMLMEVITQKL